LSVSARLRSRPKGRASFIVRSTVRRPELADCAHAPSQALHEVQEGPEQPLPVYTDCMCPDSQVAVVRRHRPPGVRVGWDGVAGQWVMLQECLASPARDSESPIADPAEKLQIRAHRAICRALRELYVRDAERPPLAALSRIRRALPGSLDAPR
jgi:hypothetical protein